MNLNSNSPFFICMLALTSRFCSYSNIRPLIPCCLLGGFCGADFVGCSYRSNNNNNNSSIASRCCWVRNMASEGQQKFPPQKQQAQPGKQHAMDPTPQFTSPDYNPANKLQALNFSFLSYLYFFFLVCFFTLLIQKKI